MGVYLFSETSRRAGTRGQAYSEQVRASRPPRAIRDQRVSVRRRAWSVVIQSLPSRPLALTSKELLPPLAGDGFEGFLCRHECRTHETATFARLLVVPAIAGHADVAGVFAVQALEADFAMLAAVDREGCHFYLPLAGPHRAAHVH